MKRKSEELEISHHCSLPVAIQIVHFKLKTDRQVIKEQQSTNHF